MSRSVLSSQSLHHRNRKGLQMISQDHEKSPNSPLKSRSKAFKKKSTAHKFKQFSLLSNSQVGGEQSVSSKRLKSRGSFYFNPISDQKNLLGNLRKNGKLRKSTVNRDGRKRKSYFLRQKLKSENKLLMKKEQDAYIKQLQEAGQEYKDGEDENEEYDEVKGMVVRKKRKPTFILSVSSTNKRSDLTPYCFEQSVDSRIMAGSECYVQSMKGSQQIKEAEFRKMSHFNRHNRKNTSPGNDQEPYSPSRFGDATKKQIVARNSIFSPNKQSPTLQSKRTSVASGHTKRFTLGQEDLKENILAMQKVQESQAQTRKSGYRGKSEFFSDFSINIPQQVEIDGEDNRMASLTEENSLESSSSRDSRSSSTDSSSSSSLPKNQSPSENKFKKNSRGLYTVQNKPVQLRKTSEQLNPIQKKTIKDEPRKSSPIDG